MNASSFHQKCNGISPTVSIIKTTKGYKFGGYTEKKWENNSGGIWIKDDKSFVFSFDHMKIYNHIQGKDAVLHNNEFGPTFDNCIYLVRDFSKNENYTCKGPNLNYFSGFTQEFELNY